MSGGVDSAVAALLLARCRSTPCRACSCPIGRTTRTRYCTTAGDFQDARRVCDALGIALHRVSFAGEYRERVFRHFLREYAAGRTPNPDVLCNREIKFGVCLDYMQRLGASWIATGHYAQVRHGADGPAAAEGGGRGQGPELLSARRCRRRAARKRCFPSASLRKSRGAADGACGRPAGIRQTGQHRHLFHRRAAVPGVLEPLPAHRTGTDRDRRRPRSSASIAGLALYTLGQRSGLCVWAAAPARRRALVRGATRTPLATRSSWFRIKTIRCCSSDAFDVEADALDESGEPHRRPLDVQRSRRAIGRTTLRMLRAAAAAPGPAGA